MTKTKHDFIKHYQQIQDPDNACYPGGQWWEDVPQHKMGTHDGLPDTLRKIKAGTNK